MCAGPCRRTSVERRTYQLGSRRIDTRPVEQLLELREIDCPRTVSIDPVGKSRRLRGRLGEWGEGHARSLARWVHVSSHDAPHERVTSTLDVLVSPPGRGSYRRVGTVHVGRIFVVFLVRRLTPPGSSRLACQLLRLDRSSQHARDRLVQTREPCVRTDMQISGR